jgi:alpha-L-fucosidase 2
MTIRRFLLFSFSATLICRSSFAQPVNKLWYNKPAAYFEEALVLGNGKVGATVFGGVPSEQIYLNDATLWSGEPVNPYMNPQAHTKIPGIRQALMNEDYKLAGQLNKEVQGRFSQSYAPLGTLHIAFEDKNPYENYYRELDISRAVVKVKYDQSGINYTREYFVSYPDQVMVIKFSASKKKALNFELRFQSLLKYSAMASGGMLQVNGYAPYHAEPDYRRVADPVRFDENRGTRFSSYIQVKNTGGQLMAGDSTMKVVNADEVIIFVSIATSFNGFDKDPAKQGLDNRSLAGKQLLNAFTKSYQTLMNKHVQDHQYFFNRVKFDLNETPVPDLPTDERLKRYTLGTSDKNLEILYFQYGRYLLIASSRTKGVPANLQGIWNPYLRPPWSSNYTLNINAEENYWLAESANLSEMHAPFLNFIGNLAQTGKITAKTFYGVYKGWAACHNSDIWAMSNPVGDFGKGEPQWANWNMGGTWAVTHLWDHYVYTGNRQFLKEYAYPLLKGAAEFCLNWLVKDKQGNLITSPSTSPENIFITPDGFKGGTLYGATADLAMIRECFDQAIKASKALNTDPAFRDSLENARNKLHPYQVGKKGNLQEWYYDWEDVEPEHRHQTHLFGLYPGRHITPEKTPALAEAAKITLRIKGDKSTGWSTGWRINLWARLKDGNQAYKIFRALLTYVQPDGARVINYGGGGGTYPNLFDAHPPFQIDGNFGGAAGVIEMLMQSSDDDGITLLPALPDAWQSGSISGICARGGFEVTLKWKNGNLEGADIYSRAGNECQLKYKGKIVRFKTKKGGRYHIGSDLSTK